LYHQTLKGMEVQDKFKEFYFTSGLYNYYMEAYPEKHPAYKPIKLLFQAGDRKKGLEQLTHCSENAVYVKNEARFFLSLIYMNYESDLTRASEYAAGLYREFPRNPLYVGKYAEILIYNNKFPIADIIVNNLARLPGDYAKMQFHLYKGILEEKYRKNYESAFAEYILALQISEKYGDAGDPSNALACMGMGRYYKYKNDLSTAVHYFRMAENVSPYDYVINDK
jgi:tetratricopeptide (TPR) repeat protein